MSEESQKLLTIVTNMGRFTFKCPPQGIASAASLWNILTDGNSRIRHYNFLICLLVGEDVIEALVLADVGYEALTGALVVAEVVDEDVTKALVVAERRGRGRGGSIS